MISASGRPLTPGLREIARLQFHVAASVPDAVPLAERAAYGERAACSGANPVSERPGYVVALDIEPVDPRAGGYTWTAVDGNLLIGLASPAGARDLRVQDLQLELNDLEPVLADLAADIASAWR